MFGGLLTIVFSVGDIGNSNKSSLFNKIQRKSQPNMKQVALFVRLADS